MDICFDTNKCESRLLLFNSAGFYKFLIHSASLWLSLCFVLCCYGRELFRDGSNVVNKSRSAYNPVRNTFDKVDSLRVCSLAGSEHLKRLCAGHKLVSDK